MDTRGIGLPGNSVTHGISVGHVDYCGEFGRAYANVNRETFSMEALLADLHRLGFAKQHGAKGTERAMCAAFKEYVRLRDLADEFTREKHREEVRGAVAKVRAEGVKT